jgi:G3E family GTPase
MTPKSSQEPIAVTVLTGFLGAGKTTLLNRLLREPQLRDTAVIVNEFGEVGIDHLLVEQSSDGVIELSDGCLCCTVRGDLVDTLADLVERVQTGRNGPLARVVIETTGLADPVPVLQAIMGHPALVQAYRLDGVVTAVDAVNALSTLERHEESRRQVAVADRLLLTKTHMEGAQTQQVVERLRALNPSARILAPEDADALSTLMLDCGLYDPSTKSADVARWMGPADGHHGHGDHHHDHHHEHDHEHHHHHGDDRIASFSLEHDGPVSWSAITTFLDLLQSTRGEQLLRMKGIVELVEDRERPLVIHAVQKLLHPPVRLPQWPAGLRGTRLVLITMDMDGDYVRRLFAAITGTPAIDTPDRAAITDNPLAIAGFKG